VTGFETAYKHAEAISFPRLAGTEGEQKAAGYIENEFRRCGLAVESQEFSFSRVPYIIVQRFLLAIGGLMVFGAVALSETDMWPLGGVIAVFCVAGAFQFLGWRKWMGAVFRPKPGRGIVSRNILAKGGTAGGRKAVIVMAHYDSKSQFFPPFVRITLFIVGASAIFFTCLALLYASAARLAGLPFWEEWFWLYLLSAAGAISGITLMSNVTQNFSNGALDNASGMGVMLAVAEHFTGKVPEDTELFFAATGAEEFGLVGSVRLLENLEERLKGKDVLVINLDCVGYSHNIRILKALCLPRRAERKKIADLVSKAVTYSGLSVYSKPIPFGVGMDHEPWAAAGYKTIGILSGPLIITSFYMHGYGDRMELVKPECLVSCAGFATRLVELHDKS
jgi:hypothetical protein